MLKPEEKEYCRALLALKSKDYSAASDHFERAVPMYGDNREFNLLRETTRLLLAVKQELAATTGVEKVNAEEM